MQRESHCAELAWSSSQLLVGVACQPASRQETVEIKQSKITTKFCTQRGQLKKNAGEQTVAVAQQQFLKLAHRSTGSCSEPSR